MKKIDLADYNLAELKGLQHDIEQAIKTRQQQEVQKAREQILAIARSAGVPVEELIANASGKGKSQKGQKVGAKYSNPDDAALTWTGRGRQPKWVVEALASGKTLDDLRVQ